MRKNLIYCGAISKILRKNQSMIKKGILGLHKYSKYSIPSMYCLCNTDVLKKKKKDKKNYCKNNNR